MPMKTLALLNPRRRRKARKSTTARSTTRRTTHRRHATVRAVRRSPVRRRRTARRGIRRSVRTSARSARTVVTVRANPYGKRSHRRGKRRGGMFRMNPFGGKGGVLGQVTGIFSKENLAILAGGVGATVVVAQVTGRFGDKLPLFKKADGSQNPIGIVLYDLAVPIAAAMAIRKYAPNVAKGIVYGGLFRAATDAIQLFAPTTYVQLYNPAAATSPAGMYLGAGGNTNVRATLGLNALAPGYQASNAFSRVRTTNGFAGPLDNSPAFAADPFASRAGRN